MRHDIFSGNDSLDVPMGLACCYVDVILELQSSRNIIRSSGQLATTKCTNGKCTAVQPVSKRLSVRSDVSVTHLAGNRVQWQEVQIWQIEED